MMINYIYNLSIVTIAKLLGIEEMKTEVSFNFVNYNIISVYITTNKKRKIEGLCYDNDKNENRFQI